MSSGTHTVEDFNDEMNDLERGLDQERACLTFYRETLEEVDDPGVTALFQWFIQAAQARIPALEAAQAQAVEDQDWTPEMKERVEAADQTVDPAPPFDAETSTAPARADLMAIRQAVELEKATASIYHTAARRARHDDVRELWRYLAATEDDHKYLLDSYFEGLMQVVMRNRRA